MTKEEFMVVFSSILRKELNRRRLPVSTFSDLAGISRTTGTAFVDGVKKDMRISTLFKICDTLDIPVENLFLKDDKGYDGLKVNLRISGDSYTAYLSKQ